VSRERNPDSVSSARLGALVACAAALALAGAPAAGDMLELKSGAVIQGTVLKRTDKRVWIDVGPTVLDFSIDDIRDIDTDVQSVMGRITKDTLFHTAENLSELSPKEHAKRIGPAVIKVSTPSGLGSGVIIDDRGYAITNAHVVQGETTLRTTVWFPTSDETLRRTVIEDIEIIAVNNHLDLALLRMTHPDDGVFPSAPLEAAESIEVGQVVFTIGNPLGLERTLSQGVVSTTQRSIDGLTYIQTDAAINPGNSGGPLFNTKGEVIGITNMGIRGGEALGFAIPARYVKDFIRNREAFAFDKSNPNSGHDYHQPPTRQTFGVPSQLRDGSSTGAPPDPRR